MLEPFFLFANACTLVTMSCIALKIRNYVESWEPAAVPLLTGLASLLMLLQPDSEGAVYNMSYAPIIMAALRYGMVSSLLSGVVPSAYLLFTQEGPWLMHFAYCIALPAIVSPLFHKREYHSGYALIRIKDGLAVCAVLAAVRMTATMPETGAEIGKWLWTYMLVFAVSGSMITVLIALTNDDTTNWIVRRQLEIQANQDGLTRLPNLRSFMNIAKNATKRHRVSILMADIDNFKNYNDRLGHLQGDELLRQVGAVLLDSVGERDYIARYGGEEFIFLCDTSRREELERIAENLCRSVAEYPFPLREVDDHDFHRHRHLPKCGGRPVPYHRGSG